MAETIVQAPSNAVKVLDNQVFKFLQKVGRGTGNAKSARAVVPGDPSRVYNIDWKSLSNLAQAEGMQLVMPAFYLVSGTVEPVTTTYEGVPDKDKTALRVDPYKVEYLGTDPTVLEQYGIHLVVITTNDLPSNSTRGQGVSVRKPVESVSDVLAIYGGGEDEPPLTVSEIMTFWTRHNSNFPNPPKTPSAEEIAHAFASMNMTSQTAGAASGGALFDS